ncbi:MAG: sensor histidine kinase [Clostridiaceae bacterium]
MNSGDMFWAEQYTGNMKNLLIIIDEKENIVYTNKKARRYLKLKDNKELNIRNYFNKIKCYDLSSEIIDYNSLSFINIIKSDFKLKNEEELVEYKGRYFQVEASVINGRNISILINDVSKFMSENKNIYEKNEELTSLAKELMVKCALNTNLRKKEHELRTRLEEINRSNKDFFNFVSHELRTPLTIIISSIQLCKEVNKKEITKKIDKTLLRINQNAKRLLKLVNNILDLTKANAGHLTIDKNPTEIVSYSEYIVESVNTYAKVKNINIIFDTTHEEGILDIDRDKYEKILLNILSNAIKYSSENKNIYVNLELYEDSFKVLVKDEGIGIPKDKIKYIFQSFAQVQSTLAKESDGTGLGLSLVQKYVELMNGNIDVYSEIDKGSTFVVEFKCPVSYNFNPDKFMDYNGDIFRNINLEFSDIC